MTYLTEVVFRFSYRGFGLSSSAELGAARHVAARLSMIRLTCEVTLCALFLLMANVSLPETGQCHLAESLQERLLKGTDNNYDPNTAAFAYTGLEVGAPSHVVGRTLSLFGIGGRVPCSLQSSDPR